MSEKAEHVPDGPRGHGLWTTADWAQITDRHGCEVSLSPEVAVLTARAILMSYRPELLAADEGGQ